jgi:MscS family membrane protein
MKLKFQTLFRGFLFFLILLWAWALWAAVTDSTNRAPISPTNEPSVLVRRVEQLENYSLTFKLDEVAALREHSFLGEPLWKYLASLLYIVLAVVVAKIIDVVTNVWLKKIASRTATKLDDLILELLRGPIKVVVFILLLNIGLNFFDWSPRAKLYLSKALILVVAGALTYLAIKILNVLLDAWRSRHAQDSERRFNDQLFSVIRVSLDTFFVVVAALVTAQNMDINITAALASLSIGGLAVGLAAQDTLANLFGALAVFVDKPFRVGDQIKLDGAEGMVEIVGLRSTRVRSPEGHLVAVPNKTMGNATITNISKRPNIKTVINLVLACDLPAAKIKRAITLLEQIYRGHSMTQDAWVSFNQFAGSNPNIVIVHWWKGNSQKEYLAALQDMNLAVKEKFEAEGITMA